MSKWNVGDGADRTTACVEQSTDMVHTGTGGVTQTQVTMVTVQRHVNEAGVSEGPGSSLPTDELHGTGSQATQPNTQCNVPQQSMDPVFT